jgi:uncharacterized protein (TIGR02996 family)
MTTDDLLAAIVNRPHDDAPRLAYAEAIAASDQQRAELIRAQITLARPREADSPPRQRLRLRVKALIKAHGERWRARLPTLKGMTWGQQFVRGFVEHCEVANGGTFRRHAAKIFAAAPVVGLSCQHMPPAGMPELLAVPDLTRIRQLYLHGDRDPNSLGDPEAALLADCPHLTRLRTLNLYNNRLTEVGVQAMADSPFLGRLRSLDLTQNLVGPDGLRALAHSTALRLLCDVDLYGNKLDEACVIDLAGSPLAGRLRRLNVGGSSATAAAARALADSPALTRLRSLDIDNSRIGDAGLMYLAHSPHLQALRELYLRHADIGDAGIAVLLRSPMGPRLRVLDIEAADITEVAAWQLVRSPDLDRLRKLEMWDCDNLLAPVCNALKLRFGKRVTVHVDRHIRRPKSNPDEATRESFLADIRARPEDDAPRLIYADWLEEHDDSVRAEFIRLQCELAQLGKRSPRRPALERRVLKLLEANRSRWTEGAFHDWLQHQPGECPVTYPHKVCKAMAMAVEARLMLEATKDEEEQKRLKAQQDRCGKSLEKLRLCEHQVRLPLFSSAVFERGFINSAVVPELMLLDFTAAVRDLGVVRHLTALSDELDPEVGDLLTGRVIALFDNPRLRTLVIQGHVEKLSTFEMMAAWPGAAELRSLEFGFIWDVPGDDVLRALASSPYFRKLTTLRLYLCNGFTEAGATALVESVNLPALKAVDLGEDENDVPPGAVRILRKRFRRPTPEKPSTG